MNTIIAGSRTFIDYSSVLQAVAHAPWEITRVISGGARGADRLGELWAGRNNIPITLVYADWEKYGKGAGHIRNEEMAEQAEALIALWDGASRGTMNMISIAKRKGLKVLVWRIKGVLPQKDYPMRVGL